MAVRIALGAGQERLFRQLLTESLLLTGAGGALGLAMAAAAVPALSRLVPSILPIGDVPATDLRVVACAGVVTLLTGIAFGVVPLLQYRRDRAAEGLREGTRSGGGRKEGLRGALVVAEITASVVLLVICGLLLRALWNIQAIDPGFETERALSVRTSLPMPKYENGAHRSAFYARVMTRIRALPGVSDAAYISFLPLSDMRGGIFPVGLDGPVLERREGIVAFLRYVTPGFFQTLGIPLTLGRDVSESDREGGHPVAVVSESFVERFFPGQDAIGRRFHFVGVEREIVGVVTDVKVRGLTRVSEPQVYLPYQQLPGGGFVWYAPKDLVIRTTGEAASLVPAVRAIVRAADPDVPLSDVQTLNELVDRETSSRVTQLRVLAAFALVALMLGGIGIHGVLAFAVSARTMEIGLRMALGAQRADVVSMIAKRSLRLAALGIAAGLVLAYVSGRAMQALLVGVTPGDPVTFGAAVVISLATAVAGSLRPALRASRVDPVIAMRSE